LTAKDALAAHARDELHLFEVTAALPVQAALTSAATFSFGAALPLLTALLVPPGVVLWAVPLASLAFLAALGAIGARTGGSKILTGVVHVTFWSALAMGITTGVGSVFGVAA